MYRGTKKIAVITFVVYLCLVTAAFAQINWVTANQATVGWDGVDQDVDGDPPPPGTHVEYKVYLVNKITDPDKTNPVEVAQTADNQATLTLSKGSFIVGLSTVHVDDSTGEVFSESTNFSWSDIPSHCADVDGDGVGDPFGFRLFAAFPSPRGMQPVSP
jgi:hypothetical protein